MVRRDRSCGGLHRWSDELRRQRRATSTDHVANGYSFTDTGVDDATWSDELCAACIDRYSFTNAGLDDATWSDELCRAARTDRYSFTDTGLDDASLTVTTVSSATSCR